MPDQVEETIRNNHFETSALKRTMEMDVIIDFSSYKKGFELVANMAFSFNDRDFSKED